MNGIVEMINRNSINAEMFLQKITLKGAFGVIAKPFKAVGGLAKKAMEKFRGGGQAATQAAASSGKGGFIKYIFIILILIFIIYLISRLIKNKGNKNSNNLGVNVFVPPINNKKSDGGFGWK